MKRTSINFSERYYKLNFNEFPTVRGKSWFQDLKEGMIFDITLNQKFFCKARLKARHLVKLEELSLGFLRTDGDYDGFRVLKKEDYLRLINRFRRFHPADWGTWVTVLRLVKVV